MKKIKVNTERLGKDAQTTGICLKNMQQTVKNMKSSVSAMEKMWEGSGRNSFHNAWNDDMNRLEQILKSLNSINTYENTAKNEYDKCEKKVSNIISGMKI